MPSSRQLISGLALAVCLTCSATAGAASSETENRVAWMRLVQGDVRISRGGDGEPDLDKPWEQASTGMLVDEGFSIATGNGRVEIEFDGGSVVYVASASVLLVKKNFEWKRGAEVVPLLLLTGTATFSLRPTSDLWFWLETPTDQFPVTYPERERAFIRLDSYINGVAITPGTEKGDEVVHGDDKLHLTRGQPVFVRDGWLVDPSSSGPLVGNAEWDSWVEAQETEYRATVAKALRASGVASPFMGLAELYQDGKFFSCEDGITCWQPKQEQTSSATTPSPGSPGAGQRPPGNAQGKPNVVEEDRLEDVCADTWVHVVKKRDAKGKLRTVSTTRIPSPPSWQPFACEPDGFLFYEQHYVPAYHRDRHHQHHHRHHPNAPAVHWVKAGGRVGLVPTHPKDVKGKPPLNLVHGILLPPKERGGSFVHLDGHASESTAVLSRTPIEFRGGNADASGVHVGPPPFQARFWENPRPLPSGRNLQDTPTIVLDHKSFGFRQWQALASTETSSKPVVVATLSARGSRVDGGMHSADRGGSGSANAGGGRSSWNSAGSHSGSSYSGGGGGRSSGGSGSSGWSSGGASHSSGGGGSGGGASSGGGAAASGGGRPH